MRDSAWNRLAVTALWQLRNGWIPMLCAIALSAAISLIGPLAAALLTLGAALVLLGRRYKVTIRRDSAD